MEKLSVSAWTIGGKSGGRRRASALLLCVGILLGSSTRGDPIADWSESTHFDSWQIQGAEERLKRWHDMIADGPGLEEAEKLRRVNEFFNGARFVPDQELYGVADYWATPEEFITHDAGDCEDFAIAKYFTLKAMGVEPAKLRITYVKSLTLDQAHMVLAYYPAPDAEPLILDNLNQLIKPASERPDLRPVYSFNTEALWLSRTRNEQVKTGDPAQLQQWRQLVARLGSQLR